MAFGRPDPAAGESLSARVQGIKLRLAKCNSVAEIAHIIDAVNDEELLALRLDYSLARPGRSAKELALLHGVRSTIAAEINARDLNRREEEGEPALAG